MYKNEPSRTTPGITLPALVAELRSRCEAASRLQGGSTYYQEELRIFRDLAEEKSLYLDSPPPELGTTPNEEGNEHQVWYQQTSETYLKTSWPDFFGMLVVHHPDQEPKASPIDYLERWSLHNQLFGDEIEFLGALQTDSGLRLLISQPAIAGEPATAAQIQEFFSDSGWLPFNIDHEIAYFAPDQ